MSTSSAVVIGRWQMPHGAHVHLIQKAFELADQVVIVIGSAWRSRNPKNPFTFDERRQMLLCTLGPAQRGRVRFVGVRDVYDEPRWARLVRERVLAGTPPGAAVTLVGHTKDPSSAYLRAFPDWAYVDSGSPMALDATQLRSLLFSADNASKDATLAALAPFMHDGVLAWLSQWMDTPVFEGRRQEHLAVEAYRRRYPGPSYRTGDAIVEAAGRYLMIERNSVLGHGLLAWPGGHQEGDDDGLDTAMRELLEETTLPVDEAELRRSLVGRRDFDAPGRSPRGRIITTACHFRLEGLTPQTLPAVMGRDDAQAKPARWLTKGDFALHMHAMFDDHDVIGEWAMGEMQPIVELQSL